MVYDRVSQKRTVIELLYPRHKNVPQGCARKELLYESVPLFFFFESVNLLGQSNLFLSFSSIWSFIRKQTLNSHDQSFVKSEQLAT
jgi:hypothetical protein